MREELIGRVVLHSGFAEGEAIAAIASVLAALRGQLGRPEAEALADALPDDFGAPLRAGRYAAVGSLAERIASAERISTGAARERVATVCRALAALLPAPILARVRHALPPDSAELLAPPAPEVPLEAHPHAQRSTLAEARPGSTHPLSESRPRPGEALRLRTEATRHAGFPPWSVLLRIATRYYLAPRALASEFQNATRWLLRARYYSQIGGGPGHVRLAPLAAEVVSRP